MYVLVPLYVLIRYLEPGHGQTKHGYFWACSRPGGDVFFQWETSRGAVCLERLLPSDFTGIVQCDAYAAYQSFAAQRGGAITLAGCLAHARRKFFEACAEAPRFGRWVLGQIQQLYLVEARLRETRAGPEERQGERAKISRPLMDRLQRVLRKLVQKRRFLPRSGLGRAIAYALENWTALSVFLQDGRVEIDNNLVENAIRPTAVGKKNWLFIGEASAGDRSADLYTIVESCRRRGIDPYAYLRDVLDRLPRATRSQVAELTPEAWACEKAATDLAAAA